MQAINQNWFNPRDRFSKWIKATNPWVFRKKWVDQIIHQADDEFTRKEIKRIINTPIKRDYLQKRPLKLSGLNIWLNPFSPFNSLGTYYGAFIFKEHSKISSFPSTTDKFVLDIGANEGFYSLYIKRYFPHIKVIAIEPDPVALRILKRNIRANHVKDVTIVNSAITDRNGYISFESIPTDTAINSIKIEKKTWMKRGIIMKIKVKSMTLPKLFSTFNIKKVDLMKIDTEGSEVKILSSAKSVLHHIRKIVVEHHNKMLHKRVKKILEKDFRLIMDAQSKYGNLYFINRISTR